MNQQKDVGPPTEYSVQTSKQVFLCSPGFSRTRIAIILIFQINLFSAAVVAAGVVVVVVVVVDAAAGVALTRKLFSKSVLSFCTTKSGFEHLMPAAKTRKLAVVHYFKYQLKLFTAKQKAGFEPCPSSSA